MGPHRGTVPPHRRTLRLVCGGTYNEGPPVPRGGVPSQDGPLVSTHRAEMCELQRPPLAQATPARGRGRPAGAPGSGNPPPPSGGSEARPRSQETYRPASRRHRVTGRKWKRSASPPPGRPCRSRVKGWVGRQETPRLILDFLFPHHLSFPLLVLLVRRSPYFSWQKYVVEDNGHVRKKPTTAANSSGCM